MDFQSLKEVLLEQLNIANNLFEHYKSINDPIKGSITIDMELNEKSFSTSSGYYDSGLFYTNSNIKPPMSLTRYTLNEKDTKSMLELLNSKPIKLSEEDSNNLYSLAKRYFVLLKYVDGKLILYLSLEPTNIQTSELEKFGDYIYYEARGYDDVRELTLPKVDILEYHSDPDDRFINLPNKCSGTVKVSNTGSDLLELTPKQYEQYVKLHPRYVYRHEYITTEGGQVRALELTHYCKIYRELKLKYFYKIEDRVMLLTDKKQDSYLDFNLEIGTDIDLIKFVPHELDRISKIEDAKLLTEPLNKPFKVEMFY